MDDDRIIAEALGLCWHECGTMPNKQCPKCGETMTNQDGWFISPESLNPDFSTWPCFGKIMELGPEQEWWDRFFYEIGSWFVSDDGEEVFAYIDFKYVDPPKCRCKLIEFLRKEK